MSDASDQIEQEARAEAIRSLSIRNLHYVGPAPIGRWTNIGIARKIVTDTLGISAAKGAAILGEHIGKTIPFKFANWTVVASIKLDRFAAQPMVNFGARNGAPDFGLSMFWNLFFWRGDVDDLQWSAGTFGGMTGGRWRTMLSGQALTLHEFTVQGTVVDELALHRAFGLPHDESQLSVAASSQLAKPRDVFVKIKRGGGRPMSEKWPDWIAAVAIEAANGNVSGQMTQTALNDLVAQKLVSWHLEEVSRTTVDAALSAILNRFREEGI